MRRPQSEAILDTNAVLALANGDVLELLSQLFPLLLYPPEIHSEIQDPYSRTAFERAKVAWVEASASSAQAWSRVPKAFENDPTDQAIIALSLERPEATVLTGDRQIIRFLSRQGRDILLPEYVVVLLKHAGLIPLGQPVLQIMIRRGYRLPSHRLSDLLERLGEAPAE